VRRSNRVRNRPCPLGCGYISSARCSFWTSDRSGEGTIGRYFLLHSPNDGPICATSGWVDAVGHHEGKRAGP
jgi:hypothetical protein